MSQFNEADVRSLWRCARTHNSSIPDEALDAMRETLLATLRQQPTNPPEIGSKLVGQQAEQAGGVVSDAACNVPPSGWSCSRAKGHDGPCAALPVGKIPTEIVQLFCRALLSDCGKPGSLESSAMIGLEAVAPLLRAPAEQGKRLECRFGEGGIGIVPGDVAGRPAVFLTEVAAPGEVGKPIPKGECGETRVVLTFPTKEQASRVVAALAQNAQADVFAQAAAASPKQFQVKPAERARVPDGWVMVPPEITDDMEEAWISGRSFAEGYRRMLAAAPSAPGGDGGAK